MEETDLKEACLSKLRDFQKSTEEIQEIEHQTIGQHENDTYNTYRCDRLTASQFGMVGFIVLNSYLKLHADNQFVTNLI